MTKQAIFNKVYRHLLAQGRMAVQGGNCMYFAPDGTKCAVGCLISKTNYHPAMEGRNLSYLRVYNLLPSHLEPHIDFLRALQGIHDGKSVEAWKKELEYLANDYGLKVPKVLT